MNNEQKIERLQFILSDAIKWYKECFEYNQNKDHEDYLDPDSLTYDDSYRWFHELDRGRCQEILEILSEVSDGE